MKHIRSLLATAAVLLLGAALLSSCDKNNPLAPNKSNPTEYSLPGCDFNVTLLDHEQGYSKDSTYIFEGIWKENAFRFGYYKLDPMTPNILPDNKNQLVFKISSNDPSFQGVNASSSAQCINIVPDGKDHTVYHLEWVAEGESTITLWCGEDATRKEISFKATSKKEIPFEGFRVRFNDRTIIVNENTTEGQAGMFSIPHFKQYGSWDKLPVFEIVGPEPLNATLPDNQFIALSNFFVLLHNTDKNGNGTFGPNLTTLYTYDEIKSFWPEFRWLSEEKMQQGLPLFLEGHKKNYPDPETAFKTPEYRTNLSDLRERHTPLYKSKFEVNRTTEYRGELTFTWGLLEINEDNTISNLMKDDLYIGAFFHLQ